MLAPPLAISERDFQAMVRELAEWMGWRTYHTWRSDHSPAGYPDLTMVRGRRIVYAELKSERGRVSQEQAAWLDALLATGQCEVKLWRPSMWESVVATLGR